MAEKFGTGHHEFHVGVDAGWRCCPSGLAVRRAVCRQLGRADLLGVAAGPAVCDRRSDGDGGDELFAGYQRYRATRLAGLFDRVPACCGD